MAHYSIPRDGPRDRKGPIGGIVTPYSKLPLDELLFHWAISKVILARWASVGRARCRLPTIGGGRGTKKKVSSCGRKEDHCQSTVNFAFHLPALTALPVAVLLSLRLVSVYSWSAS